jgi:hypothetical protein
MKLPAHDKLVVGLLIQLAAEIEALLFRIHVRKRFRVRRHGVEIIKRFVRRKSERAQRLASALSSAKGASVYGAGPVFVWEQGIFQGFPENVRSRSISGHDI